MGTGNRRFLAENPGEAPNSGDDMRQSGEDMVLWPLSTLNHDREGCSDLFRSSASGL
jgi:hypothetical protein